VVALSGGGPSRPVLDKDVNNLLAAVSLVRIWNGEFTCERIIHVARRRSLHFEVERRASSFDLPDRFAS